MPRPSLDETKIVCIIYQTDKNGKPVILAYEKDGNNLKLDVINEDKSTQTRGWKKGLKCGLGNVSGGKAGTAASCF